MLQRDLVDIQDWLQDTQLGGFTYLLAYHCSFKAMIGRLVVLIVPAHSGGSHAAWLRAARPAGGLGPVAEQQAGLSAAVCGARARAEISPAISSPWSGGVARHRAETARQSGAEVAASREVRAVVSPKKASAASQKPSELSKTEAMKNIIRTAIVVGVEGMSFSGFERTLQRMRLASAQVGNRYQLTGAGRSMTAA